VTDYITASNLASWLNISGTSDDARLALAVTAASRAVEKHCSQVFTLGSGTAARTYTAASPWSVNVDPIAATSGLVVKTDTGNVGTYDTTWTVTTDYILEPAGGIVDGVEGWPYTEIEAVGGLMFPTWGNRPRVQVTATWGWPAVPDDVTFAVRLKAARLFRRATSPDGIAGGLDVGIIRISRFEDPDVVDLLNPYVSVGRMIA